MGSGEVTAANGAALSLILYSYQAGIWDWVSSALVPILCLIAAVFVITINKMIKNALTVLL